MVGTKKNTRIECRLNLVQAELLYLKINAANFLDDCTESDSVIRCQSDGRLVSIFFDKVWLCRV